MKELNPGRAFYLPNKPNFGIIGHRGLSGVAPENTLVSFGMALEAGLNWIELDVRLCRNLELMCIHDSRVERTTNQLGRVRDFTHTELNQMDAGSWFHPQFSDQGIPTLKQVLEHTKGTGVQINIEIKTPEPPSRTRLEKLTNELTAIIQNWPNDLPLPLVSCFDWTVLNRVRQQTPHIPLGYLCDSLSEPLIVEIGSQNNCGLHCNANSVTPALIEIAHQHQVPVLVFTVNDHKQASNLLSMGVFGVFSDFPLHEEMQKAS